MKLNAIADNFDISRPAVSKRIKILSESRLLKIRKEGRELYCDPQLKNLQKVVTKAEKYKSFWQEKTGKTEGLISKNSKTK